MLKRKSSRDLTSDDPTFGPSKRKRVLFRRKQPKQHQWIPEPQRIMTELLEFVLQHEEAFKK
jgi:charged multivesicular body protein 7